MQRYLWPGNVRELSNAIESAFTFSHSPVIRLDDLPAATVASRPEQSSRITNGAVQEAVRVLPIGSFAEAEREIIARALKNRGQQGPGCGSASNLAQEALREDRKVRYIDRPRPPRRPVPLVRWHKL